MTDRIAGGYAQMPAGQQMAPVAFGAAPASVLNAVKLMFVRAGLACWAWSSSSPQSRR